MEASSGEHTRNEGGIGMTLITGINNHTPGSSCFHEPVRAVDRMSLTIAFLCTTNALREDPILVYNYTSHESLCSYSLEGNMSSSQFIHV